MSVHTPASSLTGESLGAFDEELEAATEPVIEQAWIKEARRRAAEIDSGQIETLPHDQAWQHIVSDD